MGTEIGTEPPETVEEFVARAFSEYIWGLSISPQPASGPCQESVEHFRDSLLAELAARSSAPLDDGPNTARLKEVIAFLRSCVASGERLNPTDEAYIEAALAVPAPLDDGGLDAAWREAEALRSELEAERDLSAKHHRALRTTRRKCSACWNSDHALAETLRNRG